MISSSLTVCRKMLLGVDGWWCSAPLDQSYEVAYAKRDPGWLKAVHEMVCGIFLNAHRRCLESLSQKLKTPSAPAVEKVP